MLLDPVDTMLRESSGTKRSIIPGSIGIDEDLRINCSENDMTIFVSSAEFYCLESLMIWILFVICILEFGVFLDSTMNCYLFTFSLIEALTSRKHYSQFSY